MKPSMPDPIPTDGLCLGSRWLLAICLVGVLASAFSGPRQTAAAATKQPAISAPTLSWQMIRGLTSTRAHDPELRTLSMECTCRATWSHLKTSSKR
jgi:hypothetical protein